MHIAEGIITGKAAVLYTAVGLTSVGYGTRKMKQFVASHPDKRPLLAMGGALIFFISLLPIPAFTGTCSHPCGTPLIAIFFGPGICIALTGASLLLQAAFFAHGGFGSWGANVLALGVVGGVVGWGIFSLLRKTGLPLWAAGFAAGLLGDLMVYLCSGLVLAGALVHAPTPQYSFTGYLAVILAAYCPTQLPIAFGEMVITGLALQYIYRQRPEVLADLGLLKQVPRECAKTVCLTLLLIVPAAFLLLLPANASLAAAGQPIGASSQKTAPKEHVSQPKSSFTGMDEAVNTQMAEKAGYHSKPFLDLESMGDVWNGLLLLAGAICGFILGRWWHLISRRGNFEEKQTNGC